MVSQQHDLIRRFTGRIIVIAYDKLRGVGVSLSRFYEPIGCIDVVPSNLMQQGKALLLASKYLSMSDG